MSDLLIEITAGIAVIVLSGIGGFIIKSRFFQERLILPKPSRHFESTSYSHLSGKWHLYWLSYSPSGTAKPLWMHGIQDLEVEKNLVLGTTQFVDHPVLNLHSKLHGEIRAGRMIVLDVYSGDETEFASVIYPNLRSATLLVGMWNGFDNQLRPIAAPTILSREELPARILNRTIRESTISLVPIGEYESYQPETKDTTTV